MAVYFERKDSLPDSIQRPMVIQWQREEYYKDLGIPPGVPTMKGAYDDPENTGVGYNTIITELGDHSVPKNWEQYVVKREPGETPGPPIIWSDPQDPEDAQPGYGFIADDTTEEETFFYHSDHLGSTSYITDDKGNITQYTAYLPYGELLVDEHSSSEDLPYKFNGKELDEETGLYYYGARYLQPVASVWYGVDPLMEKYPEVSAYVYCHGNPINRIDPDGKDEVHINGGGKIVKVVDDKSSNITIVSSDGVKRSYSDYKINSYFLGLGNSDNRQIIANVTGYYARRLGIKGLVGATGSVMANAMAYYDHQDKGIWIPPGSSGMPNALLRNKYNLMNALLHEYYHKIDDVQGKYSNHYLHASVVARASSHWTFGKASTEFQDGQVGYFAQLAMNAFNQPNRNNKQDVQNLIQEYNSTNKGNFKLELASNGRSMKVYKDNKEYGTVRYRRSKDKVNIK